MTSQPQHTTLEDAMGHLAERDPKLGEELRAWAPVVGLIKAVVALRKEAGMTQADLARALGRKQSSIARFESGEQDPKWTTVNEVLAALGHEIKIVPADGDVVVMRRDELEEFVNSVVSDLMGHIQRQAVSNALVQAAEARKTRDEQHDNELLVRRAEARRQR